MYQRVLEALGVRGDEEVALRALAVKVREAAAQAPSLQLELQALQASFDALVLENMRLKSTSPSSSSSSAQASAPLPASSDPEEWFREKEELETQVRELNKVAKALEQQVDRQDDIIVRLQDSEDSAMLRAEEVRLLPLPT